MEYNFPICALLQFNFYGTQHICSQYLWQADLQRKSVQLEQHIARIQVLTTQMRDKDNRLRQREEELQQKETQLQQKDGELQQRNAEIRILQRETQRLQVGTGVL